MSEREREDWRAQAKFLKAYYHFLLLRQYGPMIISDVAVPLDAIDSDLFQRRNKVEDVFDYIIGLLDEAIYGPRPHKPGDIRGLAETREVADMGMIDRAGAMGIKARVLLYRASPFYSGNVEYFVDFLDHDGQSFFSMDQSDATRKAKWKAAADAADECIRYALSIGKQLYRFEGVPYLYDSTDFRLNRDKMQTLYDLRTLITTPYNKEMLWVNSNINITADGEIQNACNMRVPYENYDNNGVGVANGFSWQWLCASYNVAARYLTKNGLPMDEDPNFNVNNNFNTIFTPAIDDSDYTELRGYLQPGRETARFNLNREPRFYANLGISAGYFRTQFARIRTMMYKNDEGGHMSSFDANQRYDYYCTGIAIKKLVHPESKSNNWQRVVRFPYPIIRLADLYLMKAEALNEYLDAPESEVWDAINEVRRRAGIPDVEDSWSYAVKNRNWHTTKAGMREIILRERSSELAFEGHRFWDMYRYRRCETEFSVPIYGWDSEAEAANVFFILQPKQVRMFTERDYLWPISLSELNINGNLIQNPGW